MVTDHQNSTRVGRHLPTTHHRAHHPDAPVLQSLPTPRPASRHLHLLRPHFHQRYLHGHESPTLHRYPTSQVDPARSAATDSDLDPDGGPEVQAGAAPPYGCGDRTKEPPRRKKRKRKYCHRPRSRHHPPHYQHHWSKYPRPQHHQPHHHLYQRREFQMSAPSEDQANRLLHNLSKIANQWRERLKDPILQDMVRAGVVEIHPLVLKLLELELPKEENNQSHTTNNQPQKNHSTPKPPPSSKE